MPDDRIKKPPRLHPDTDAVHNFLAICSGQYKNIAIVPCYVNDEASMAIVATFPDCKNPNKLRILPMFVATTVSMTLKDGFGKEIPNILDVDPAAKEALAKLNELINPDKS